jgi:hypothetical protein
MKRETIETTVKAVAVTEEELGILLENAEQKTPDQLVRIVAHMCENASGKDDPEYYKSVWESIVGLVRSTKVITELHDKLMDMSGDD